MVKCAISLAVLGDSSYVQREPFFCRAVVGSLVCLVDMAMQSSRLLFFINPGFLERSLL